MTVIWFGNMQNSHEWIDGIIKRLFAAEDRYIGRMVSDLNKENSSLKKTHFQGFMHMGKKFIPPEYMSNRQWIARHPLPTLHIRLTDEAGKLTTHLSKVDLDKSQIRQVLFLLLHQCNTLQEIRDVLPECIIPMVPELAKFSRYIEDQFYMVRNDKSFMSQYLRVLPKIELYSMSRLIY